MAVTSSGTSEAASADCVLGQIAEEPLDQVHPGTAGGREVQDAPVPAMRLELLPVSDLQPGLNLGVFVRPIVVQDQVQRQVGWRLLMQLVQESQPLLVPVAGRRLAKDLAVQVGQGRKQ